MKYDMSCRVFSMMFTFMLKKYYKENFPEIKIKEIAKDVKKEYKAMIIRTPGLSKDNNMASNLKGAAYFFSMAKKVPNMTPELMDKIVLDTFKSPLMMKMKKKERETGAMFSEKAQEKMYKDSLRSQKSTDEMDWKYTYHKGKNEVSYDITKCGVCRLAERENMKDYLPCMCRMDYPKYAAVGARLDREKTLANGDDVCDFHLTRDETLK